MALKTLRCCGNASSQEQRSVLRAIQNSNPPKNYICLLGGLSPSHSKHRQGAQGLMWGTRGPFLLAAAMVVSVVTPVVFCAKATEKCNKNTKISFLSAIVLFITMYFKTYQHSRNANWSVARAWVVVWLVPEPLCPMEPRHIGYCQEALVIVRTILTLYWGQHVQKRRKREKVIHILSRTANYLRFLAFLASGSYALVVLMPHLQW
jgi:hypothetical protein